MQPQRNVQDYTQLGGAVQPQNTVLRKTYGLLGLAFLPCIAGAYFGSQFNFAAVMGNFWVTIIAFFAFFYGMCFAIEKNRYSNVGVALLMVFTFGMGFMLGPILQYSAGFANGTKLVAMAAAMTAGVFLVMAAASWGVWLYHSLPPMAAILLAAALLLFYRHHDHALRNAPQRPHEYNRQLAQLSLFILLWVGANALAMGSFQAA